jgi:hypothetical protein
MATRRPPRKRTATRKSTRSTRSTTLMTEISNAAGETKDYVVTAATQARDYLAKHPAIAVVAGAAILAAGWSARRYWLPAVAITAVERYLPDLPGFDAVVGQVKTLRPSFLH